MIHTKIKNKELSSYFKNSVNKYAALRGDVDLNGDAALKGNVEIKPEFVQTNIDAVKEVLNIEEMLKQLDEGLNKPQNEDTSNSLGKDLLDGFNTIADYFNISTLHSNELTFDDTCSG